MATRRKLTSPQPAPPVRRHGPGRRGVAQRCARLLLSALVGVFALTLALVLAITFRLSLGPVELPFLARLAEAQLEDRMGSARLTVGGAVFVLGDGSETPSGIRLTNVQIHDETDQLLVSAPQIGARFRLADAIVGRIAPTELFLFGAHGKIIRNADGRFDLALLDGSRVERDGPVQDQAAFAGFLRRFLDGEVPLFQNLSAILMSDIGLVYEDHISGRRWDAEGATVVLTRVGTTLAGAVRVRLEGDRPEQSPPARLTPVSRDMATVLNDQATELSLDIRYRPDVDGLSIAGRFVNLHPNDLAEQIPALSWLRPIAAPMAGVVSLDLLPDGRARVLTAELIAGAGRLDFGFGPGVPLTSARLDLAVDALSDRIVLSRFELDTAAGRIAATGDADILRQGTEVVGLETRIEVDALTLDMPHLFQAPVDFTGGTAHVSMALAPMRFDLHRIALQLDDADLALEGRLASTQDGWDGRLRMGGAGFDARDIVALWPIGPAPGARLWAETRLSEGRIDRLDGTLDLGGKKPALDLVFDFSDGVAEPVPGLPIIEEAAGTGRLSLRSFTVELDAGITRLESGEIDLAGSVFHIPDITVRPPTAQVSLRGKGPISAALELIDRHPLSLLSRIGARPDLAAGDAEVSAELAFPLLRKLKPTQVTAEVEAVLNAVTVGLPAPVPIRANRLTLNATQKRMQVTGPLQLGPETAQFDWIQIFKPEPGTPGGRMTARLDLTPALLGALGLNLPTDTTSGPVPAIVTATLAKGRTAFEVEASLDKASVQFPGWRKPAGTPGRLSLEGVLAGGLVGQVSLDRIALDTPDFKVAGQAVIGPGGKLVEASFDQMKLGTAIDSSLRWSPDGLRLEGGTLDLVELGKLLQSSLLDRPETELEPVPKPSPTPRQAPDLGRVDIDIDELILTPSLSLTPASGTLVASEPGTPFLTLTGPAEGGAEVGLAFTQAERGLTVRVSSPDAGRLLRDAGYFTGGHGGRLVLDLGMAPGSDALTGRLVIRDIVVRDAPLLGEILSIASITGIFEQLTTGGLTFDRVEAHFSRAEGVLYLTEGRATGGSLGITIAGAFDEPSDALSFQGVFSPAYLFNGLLGEVPVLGTLLTGPRGEGVFGFSYEVEGSASDPSVSVNPLSILTPGVLRGVLTKEAPTPPDNLGPSLPEMQEETQIAPPRPAVRLEKDHADR